MGTPILYYMIVLLLPACFQSPEIFFFYVPLSQPDYKLFVDGSCLMSLLSTWVLGMLSLQYFLSSKLIIFPTYTDFCSHSGLDNCLRLLSQCLYQAIIFLYCRDDFCAIWQCRNFLTSTGTAVYNAAFVQAFLNAIQLPTILALVKNASQQQGTVSVCMGNALVNCSTWVAALSNTAVESPLIALCVLKSPDVSLPFPMSVNDLCSPYLAVSPAEKAAWFSDHCSPRQMPSGA